MYAMPAIKHAAAEYWRSKFCMLYKPQCFGPCSVAIILKRSLLHRIPNMAG